MGNSYVFPKKDGIHKHLEIQRFCPLPPGGRGKGEGDEWLNRCSLRTFVIHTLPSNSTMRLAHLPRLLRQTAEFPVCFT